MCENVYQQINLAGHMTSIDKYVFNDKTHILEFALETN